MARAAGFSNINVDLMFAIPGQSYDGWIENLQTVAALGPEQMCIRDSCKNRSECRSGSGAGSG